jgi:hypothetical protein
VYPPSFFLSVLSSVLILHAAPNIQSGISKGNFNTIGYQFNDGFSVSCPLDQNVNRPLSLP